MVWSQTCRLMNLKVYKNDAKQLNTSSLLQSCGWKCIIYKTGQRMLNRAVEYTPISPNLKKNTCLILCGEVGPPWIVPAHLADACLDWDLGSLGARPAPWVLCHVSRSIHEQFSPWWAALSTTGCTLSASVFRWVVRVKVPSTCKFKGCHYVNKMFAQQLTIKRGGYFGHIII